LALAFAPCPAILGGHGGMVRRGGRGRQGCRSGEA